MQFQDGLVATGILPPAASPSLREYPCSLVDDEWIIGTG